MPGSPRKEARGVPTNRGKARRYNGKENRQEEEGRNMLRPYKGMEKNATVV